MNTKIVNILKQRLYKIRNLNKQKFKLYIVYIVIVKEL